MAVPKSLFSKGLDAVATKWLKNTIPVPPEVISRDLATQHWAVAEALIVAPRVTFKVYGENVVLATLAKVYGVKGLEALLKDKVIDFVLWNEHVARAVDEKFWKQGIVPISSGKLTSQPHCDVSASSEMGLRGWASWLPEQDAKRLGKLAADRTVLMPTDIAASTIATVTNAYNSGALDQFLALTSRIPIHELNDAQVGKLATIAQETLDAGVMMDREADLLDEPELWSVLVELANKMPANAGGTLSAVEKVLAIEHLPSIKELLRHRAISHGDVLKIRELPQTEEFRKWLWSLPAPTDAEAVGEAYLAAMAPKASVKDKTWFKTVRIAAVSLAGSALGTLVAGPVGGAAGFAISSAVSLGVSGVDGFSFEKLLGRRDPRRFATEVVAPIVAQKEAAGAAPEKSSLAVRKPPVVTPPRMMANQRKRDRHRRRK